MASYLEIKWEETENVTTNRVCWRKLFAAQYAQNMLIRSDKILPMHRENSIILLLSLCTSS